MAKEYPQFEFTLSPAGIDAFIEWYGESLSSMKTPRNDLLGACLLTEEVLVNMSKHYGEQLQASATLDTSLGKPRLRIQTQAEAFNPLATLDNELGEWSSILRTAIGLNPQYNYSFGVNTLRLVLPKKGMNPVLKTLITAVGALLLGHASKAVLPLDFVQIVTGAVFEPIYLGWLHLLGGISAPIIFFSALSTMISTKEMNNWGTRSWAIIGRYLGLSILAAFCATAVADTIFRAQADIVGGHALTARTFIDGLLAFVPTSIIDPFSTSNTAQLLLIAIVFGYILNSIGDPVEGLSSIFQQVNMAGLALARLVSNLVPYLVGVYVWYKTWDAGALELINLWQPLVMALAVSAIFMLVGLIHASRRMRTSPANIARKIGKPFMMSLRTGSLDSSFEEAMRSCTRLLGIDADYARKTLPQGLVLYMPISIIGIVVFTFFVAHASSIQINEVWRVSLMVLAVMLFVATPPVPGANLLAYVALFGQLGIAEQYLVDAMVFDVLFGVFATAANQFMLQISMTNTAHDAGMLKDSVLQDASLE